MSNKTVLDRVDEVRLMTDWLQENSGKNACLIVAARTGVGKSTLTNHFSQSFDDRFFLRISVSRNSAKTIQAGSYLRALARSIVNLAEIYPDITSFQDVELDKSRREAAKQLSMLAVDVVVPKKIRTALVDAHNKWTGKGKENWSTKLREPQATSLSDVREYVTSVLMDSSISLIFENAQNMDEYSLDALLGALTISTPHAIFLEFTATDDSDYGVIHELKNRFEHINCVTNILKLNKLPINELFQLIPESNRPAINVLEQSYGEWNGNLAPLVDLSCILAVGDNPPQIEQFDFDNVEALITSNVSHLSDLANTALLHIAILGGEVEAGLLSEMMRFDTGDLTDVVFRQQLLELEDRELIQSASTSTLVVRHDSVIDAILEDYKTIKAATLAASEYSGPC